MKTKFLWAWNDYPAQPDPLMTRKRAAVLLMAWRRTSRQMRRDGTFMRTLRRIGPGVYKVTDDWEAATLHILRA